MVQEEKNKFEVGKWYQDRDNDFIKFKEFNRDNYVNFTARVRDNNYRDEIGSWNLTCIVKCTPMTIKEMKKYLPKEEWWVEWEEPTKPINNDLFPIY